MRRLFAKYSPIMTAVAAVMVLTIITTGCAQGRTPPGADQQPQSSSQSDIWQEPAVEALAPTPQPEESQDQVPDEPLPPPNDMPDMPQEILEELSQLSDEAKPWGSGGPVDELGRSVGALSYNQLYGHYGATFVEQDSDDIYLTFDLGYENGYTDDFLDAMAQRDVKGVFFVTGGYLRSEPEMVQRIIDEGHVLGSHSDGHPNMTTITLSEAYDDTKAIHNAITNQFGYEPKLYRFPEGVFNEQLLYMLQQSGYKSVFWSFAYRDWEVDNQPDPQESLAKLVDSAHPGGIYLIHTVSSTNVQIIGDVIDGFEEKGFKIGDPNDLI